MKKCLMILVSTSVLSISTAQASLDPTLTSLPNWGVFATDPANAATLSAEYASHGQRTRALKAAYDAWLADSENAIHAAAAFKAMVGGAGAAANAILIDDELREAIITALQRARAFPSVEREGPHEDSHASRGRVSGGRIEVARREGPEE